MRKLTGIILIIMVGITFLFNFVGAEPVDVKLKGFLVEESDGEEVLKPLEAGDEPPKVAPGDTLEYLLVARNKTDQSIGGLSLKGPVPESTELNANWYRKIVGFVERKEEERPVFMVLKEDKTAEDSREVPMKLPGRLPKFSINGGESYSYPPVKYEEDEEMIEAEPSELTHVLWEVSQLPANGEVQVRYRVTVQ